MLFACRMALADGVTPEQARTAVANWLLQSPKRLTAKFETANAGKVSTSTNAKGLALYHIVNLEEGGFVVTSGDTTITPIVAFSGTGELDVSDVGNPLLALLERDMSRRLGTVAGKKMTANDGGNGKGGTEEEWAALLQPGDKNKAGYGAVASLSDIRVEPMVASKWGQSYWNGYATFNYYTPKKYVSGCVATAFAQIMRYWQKPTASVTAGSYRCWVDGVGSTYTMKGETYEWSSMPLTSSTCTSEAQRQAIGKLLYDVGVASQMEWTGEGSGTLGCHASQALRSRFGYASSQSYFDITGYGLTQDFTTQQGEFRNAILASLDAGMPVAIGVGGDNGGHEMVVDGYGYSGSKIYCHINCGWSGDEDAWYNLLGGYITSAEFGYLDEVGYNIHPTTTGDVISGRVLNSSGTAVSGATVTLTLPSGGTRTATSNSKGIYFFRVTSSGTYKVSASNGSLSSTVRTIALTMSTACTAKKTQSGGIADAAGNSVYNSSGDYVGPSGLGGTLGNSWGNDLTLSSSSGGGSSAAFEIGEVVQFTLSGTQRATVVGLPSIQWSDFSGTDAFGTKVLVNAGIVDAEKTAGASMKDDDTWCYPLSDMNALFWTGWAQAETSYATVDAMANYFRSNPSLLRTWNNGDVQEGEYGYDGIFNWFEESTGVNLWDYTTYGRIDRTFGKTIRPLLDDGSHVIRLAVYFSTTSNPKWSWCNASGGVSHGVLCVGYVADTSKDSGDPSALKALFIVDPDNSQSVNGGGASAPNTVAYCPVTWNESTGEWYVQGVWGETSVLCEVGWDADEGYRALARYGAWETGEIGDVMDCADLSFSQYGGGVYDEWSAWSDVSCHRGAAMQSGTVGFESWSSFAAEIEGPAYVDFLWRLDSGYTDGIGLATYLDEYTQVNLLVSDSGWTGSSAEIPAGTHMFEWCFFNNVSDEAGENTAGYVDWLDVYYGITFDMNGGSGEVKLSEDECFSDDSGEVWYCFPGNSLTFPAADGLSRSGYEFAGWSLDGTAYQAGATVTMPSRPVKLTALWKEAASRFELVYGGLSVLNAKGSYFGHIFDEDNWIIGTVEVKAAAMKNSSSRLQATISMQGSAPIKLKGATTGWNGYFATAVLSGSGKVMRMQLCHENVYGSVNGYFFDCSRNFAMDLKGGAAYKSKINAAKRNYALSMRSIPVSGSTAAGNGYIGTSIQVGLKGKTKLVGVLPDLGKISATVYLETDAVGTYAPVYAPINMKKGSYGAVLLSTSTCRPVNATAGVWNNKGGKKNLTALLLFDEAARVSKPATSRFRWFIPDSSLSQVPGAIAGGAVQYAAFPGYYTLYELAFSANKWTAVNDAASKMKLTYAPKTGLLKGSFYATTTKGKKKVTVNGVFVNHFADCFININKSHTAEALIYAN